MLQIFFKINVEKRILLVVKVVDDLKVTRVSKRLKQVLPAFHKTLTPGTVSRGPEEMRFFSIPTSKEEEVSVISKVEDKIQTLLDPLISSLRRNEGGVPINAVEKYAFASVKSPLG